MARPNILFLLPDQHRGDWLGSNPDLPLRTPNLDALAARGTTFTRAYTPSPVCAPARACLASGRDYEQCRVPSNKESYPVDLPTYYQRLRGAGYRVAGVGKFDLHKDLRKPQAELDWGLDGSRGLEQWGFTEGIDNEGKFDGSASYRAAGRPKGPYLKLLNDLGLADAYAEEHAHQGEQKGAYVTCVPDDAYCDNWLSENGLKFLRDFPEGQPWHLVVNFTGPHNPMDVTPRMRDAWEGVTFPAPVNNDQANYSEEDHQRNRRYYAAMIENIDRQVGRFIDAVRERGELDNTLIVYSSDHGEMLGDHSRWGKSVPHEPSVNIPMIIAGPGVREGRTSDALVALHDLAPTFLEAGGCEPLPRAEAHSLCALLRGDATVVRTALTIALGNWRAVITDRFKYVKKPNEDATLFDLLTDRKERRDLSTDRPEVCAELSGLL